LSLSPLRQSSVVLTGVGVFLWMIPLFLYILLLANGLLVPLLKRVKRHDADRRTCQSDSLLFPVFCPTRQTIHNKRRCSSWPSVASLSPSRSRGHHSNRPISPPPHDRRLASTTLRLHPSPPPSIRPPPPRQSHSPCTFTFFFAAVVSALIFYFFFLLLVLFCWVGFFFLPPPCTFAPFLTYGRSPKSS